MQKRYRWGLPYVLAALCLLIASFYDYPISQALYQPEQLLGCFFERFMLLPVIAWIPVCFYGLYRLKQNLLYLLAYYFTFLYIFFDTLHYWLAVGAVWLYVLSGGLLTAWLIQLCLAYISHSFWQRHETFLHFFLHVSLSALLITFVVKRCWGRVRYRNCLDNPSLFTPWYVINGFQHHYSFPSAHTAMMCLCLCFCFFQPKKQSSHQRLLINSLLVILCIGMMISRIIMGAHYLSDVLFGFLITYTMILFWFRREMITCSKEK